MARVNPLAVISIWRQQFRRRFEQFLVRSWQKRGVWYFLMLPLSFLWYIVARYRYWKYQRHLKQLNQGVASARKRLPVRILVIGNIVVGGAGKTPLTLACVAGLKQKGWRPGIVSRGYGRKTTEIIEVDAFKHDSDTVGDEPLLLKMRSGCPVVVGQDRHAAAQYLLTQHPEVNLIVLDDGLQHLRLVRDVEIVVFDARGIGNGACLPAGLLRDPISRLQHVSAVVGNGILGSKLPLPAIPFYRMELQACGWRHLASGTESTFLPQTSEPSGQTIRQKIAAVAGIAHPERFFHTLHTLDLNFSEHVFPDHHRYHLEDIQQINAEIIVMTEKDAVKCRLFNDKRVWVLVVDAQIDPALLDDIDRRLHGSSVT